MKSIVSIFFAVTLSLVISIAIFPAYTVMAQATIYVDADANGLNDGSSWENAYTNLQSALADTDLGAGDQIWVAAGTYTPGTVRTDSFDLVDGVTLYGGFAGGETSLEQRNWENNETILSGEIGTDGTGDNSYHVVTSSGLDEYAVLDGFTITGGNANGTSHGAQDRGGGMYNYNSSSPTVTNCIFRDNNSGDIGGGMQNDNSSPTVTDCTFENNSASNAGGGMYNNNSSPTVDDCTFRDNLASQGGGMQNYDSSSPTVTGCTFSGNSGMSGGGMYNIDSSPTVTDSTFYNNSVIDPSGNAAMGGGMYNKNNSSANVTSCSFSSNSAEWGGGMCNDSSSPTVTNCIFSGNSATEVGGGMGNYSSSPTVTNCTFYGNSAGIYDGGGVGNLSSSPTVTNCILWNNSPDQIKNYGGSPTVSYSDIQNQYIGVNNNINANPVFADPDNSDFHLLSDSPCIDAGSNAAVPGWLTTDFEGDPRISPIDGTVDMGADEFVPEAELITATIDIKPDTLNLNTKGKWITGYIELEEGYDVADIDVSTVKLNDAVNAESRPNGIGDCDEDGIPDLMVKFDRTSVQEIPLEVGDEVEIVITGELDGTSFEGTDTIRVIDKSND